VPSYPGVRSPPLPRGGGSQARWPGGERLGDRRFSRRDALCGSAWYGLPDALAFHPHPMRRRTAGGLPATCLGQARAFLTGVRSPPLRGVGYPSWDGLAGKGRKERELRFSRRGAVSASGNTGPTQTGACHRDPRVGERPVAKSWQRWRYALPTGVRSPPLRGVGYPSWDGLAGENPGITRRVVFSEGRTLCVRVVRPDEWQGIALPPGPFREAGGQEGAMLCSPRCLPLRACGARPSAGWAIQAGMA